MTDFEKELNYFIQEDMSVDQAYKAILVAHEADIERIIGEDEPDPTQVTHSDDGSTTITLPTGELDRNLLRASQRSRAKGKYE